jgi:pentatricopeptide repeat protein
MGFSAHRPLICIALFCFAFSAARQVFITPFGFGGETQVHTDLFLWVGVIAYFLDPYSARAMEWITKVRKVMTTNSATDKISFDGGRRESPENVDLCHGSSKDSEYQFGVQSQRMRADMRIMGCAQTEAVAHKASKVWEEMYVCIRFGHRDTVLKLFEQMLEKGALPDAHLIAKAVSQKYFNLVAGILDDKRLRDDGLRLLKLIQAHGLPPSNFTQNRFLHAWKNQLPKSVLQYFLEMRSDGVILSRWVYRYIVVVHERSDPSLALKIYDEMEGLGITTNLAAYNAVLGACFQLGMHEEARHLFMQMSDRALEPNGKTYGIMIRVYSSSNELEEALALFETMRDRRMKPNRFEYDYGIRFCIALERISHAVELYKDMVQANMSLCVDTRILLSRACQKVGWSDLADKLTSDLGACRRKRLHGPHLHHEVEGAIADESFR